MFIWQEIISIIKRENPSYDEHWTSRLHNMEQCIFNSPHNSPQDVNGIVTAASSVRADAWTKYPRTRGWLMWKAAQQSRVIPGFPPIVVSNEPIVHGSGVLDRANYPVMPVLIQTGIVNQPESFNWSILVTYTLTRGVDPANYAPYRTVKSLTSFQDGANAPLAPETVRSNALGKPVMPDGPCYKNVKRTNNQIIIWDDPGMTLAAEGGLSSWGGYHPIQFCALFEMTLLALRDGIKTNNPQLIWNTVTNCTEGQAIANSRILYGVYMEKNADGTMHGAWSDSGASFTNYGDPIAQCAPPHEGLPPSHLEGSVGHQRRGSVSQLPSAPKGPIALPKSGSVSQPPSALKGPIALPRRGSMG